MKKIFTVGFICFLSIFTKAQWNGNPTLSGNAVCTATSDELSKISITDGSNGSIVVFTSSYLNTITNTYYTRINAQRISSTGSLVWSTANNPKIVSDTGDIYISHAISDGVGGVFIAYDSYTNNIGEVFVQHINSSGNISWAATGVNISNNAIRNDENGRLCLDGSGGVIVSWTSNIRDNINNTTYLQTFAQRLNSSGVTQWTAGGVQLSTANGFRLLSDMVTDGAGGTIAFFVDTRNSQYFPGTEPEFPNLDIYAQRITATGNRAWTDNGVAVSTEPNVQFVQAYEQFNAAVSDGVGGAILVYADNRNGNANPADLYTQRVNSAGVKQWTSAGVNVCAASGEQYINNVVPNGANGIVTIWQDERTSSNNRIYAQQINSSGTALWNTDGVLFSGAADIANGGDIKPDGLGSYIASWNTSSTTIKIKSQKINNAGTIQWAVGGVDVYSITNNYNLQEAQVTISDNGKAIVTWIEDRSSSFQAADIYAKKLEVNGILLPLTILTYTATLQNNQVLNQWQTANEVNVSHMNVQRSVDGTNFSTLGKVNAKGGGKYEFWDNQLPTTTKLYYRLQMVDKDGAISYSKIVTINRQQFGEIIIQPNPVNHMVNAQITHAKKEQVMLQITDLQGRILHQQSALLTSGTQSIKIDVSKLTAGSYLLSTIGEKSITKPFIKQ